MKRTLRSVVIALMFLALPGQPGLWGEPAPDSKDDQTLTRAELEADGIKYLVVSGRRKGKLNDIYIIDLGGKIIKQLTDTPEKTEFHPRSSPDGKWIAYTVQRPKVSYRDEWCDAYLMKPDGSGARKVMERVHNLCWSSDGKQLACATGRDPDKEWVPRGFRILNVDTGEVRWVATKYTGGILDLAWAHGEIFAYRVRGPGRTIRGGINYQTSFYKPPVFLNGGCHSAITRDGKTVLNNWTDPVLGVITNVDEFARTGDPSVLKKRSLKVPVSEACPVISEDGKYILVQGLTRTTLGILRVSDFARFEIVGDEGKLSLAERRGGYWSDFLKGEAADLIQPHPERKER